MKNACIVIKKRGRLEGAENALLECFSLNGYIFEEIRILLEGKGEGITATLQSLKAEYDNLLLIADKTSMATVRGYILPVFAENTQYTAFSGASIFVEGNRALFFLSADETETGMGFLKNACIPYLQQKYNLRFNETVVRAMGASEGKIQSVLSNISLYAQGKLLLRHTRRYDEDIVGLSYDSDAPKMLVDEGIRMLVEGLGDSVYAMNDSSLEEQLVNLLKLRGKKISVAESFTGGGIAKRITSVSGASEVYFEGLNTYAEEAKIKRLGVSEYVLKTTGAVSDQVAYEMALGLLNTGDCDISIATTGLAGPNTDRSMLPVGLCFIAVGTKEKILVYRYKFDGDRRDITEKAINYALFLAYKQLKKI